MKFTGAQIALKCLKEQGVDTIFGYPGGAVIPLYDALYDELDYFNHILTCHEQGATHAADGYARSTGKVGVCFATSGPGATNTVTGIATAYMDSVPMVVITGQVPISLIGKDSFQEVDITGITLPITKHNFFVRDINELEYCINKAFIIAQSGRPGPVLIDIPKNIFSEKVEYKGESNINVDDNTLLDIDSNKIDKIVELINCSEKPVIYAGGGIITSNASEEFSKFVLNTNIPVVNTLMGLGSFPREHELSLGLVGMHGSREANLAMSKCDLVIAIGARFSDRVTGDTSKFAKMANIIHIDIDESEINKNIKANYSVIGDIKNILNVINKKIVECGERKEWHDKINNWIVPNNDNNSFVPRNILNLANEVLGDKTLVTTEVGQHQMWTAQYWKFSSPRSFISSGGLGTMGFGLGAAIGTKIGNPEKTVLHVAGDGSFRMNCNELATVSSLKLPIITLLFKNNTLGMVRQWQKMFHNKRYSSTSIPDVVDYIKLAAAYGVDARNATDLESLKIHLNEAKNIDKPIIIVCEISEEDCVFPMVPPGAPIENIVLE